jgi:enoyl-CoA hydratase
MDFECIQYEKQEGLAVIRFNRPHVLNAMNQQLWFDFQAALEDVQKDDDVRALVITGNGRAFSTGADLKESKQRSPSAYRAYLVTLQEISRRLIRLDKPTIAAINGYALGSGYEIALACDIRIAAAEAQIGSPEAKVASSVTGGALRLLQDLVGPGKARELLFTGRYIDGHEAARIGLVNQVVPLARLMETAFELAREIIQNAPFSLKMIKKGLLMAQGEASLEALMDFEVEACLACVATEERTASLTAFEKRSKKETS